MNEGLVQVEDEGLFALVLLALLVQVDGLSLENQLTGLFQPLSQRVDKGKGLNELLPEKLRKVVHVVRDLEDFFQLCGVVGVALFEPELLGAVVFSGFVEHRFYG